MIDYRFTSVRWIDGKLKKVIVDICGDIINRNPIKEELKNLKRFLSVRYILKLPEEEKKKYLSEFLRYFDEKKGRPPTMEDFTNNPKYPNFNAYRNEFGSWNRAKIEAGFEGFELNDNTRSKQSELHTMSEFKEEDSLDLSGENRKLIKLVSLEESRSKNYQPNEYTERELIEKMQRWAEEHRRPPRKTDFTNNPKYPSFATYQRVFGSWNNALIESGLEVGVIKGNTRQVMIEKMKQFEKENGRPPVAADFRNNPKYPSLGAYLNEFDIWNNAKIAAGYEPNDESTRSRLGELQTLSEFKEEGYVDLSGNNRHSICDGINPDGEHYDVKSASLTQNTNGALGWSFWVSIEQLEEAETLTLRAYEDRDFSKPPKYVWVVPIGFMDNRMMIFIYKDDNRGLHNVKTMKKYQVNKIVKR